MYISKGIVLVFYVENTVHLFHGKIQYFSVYIYFSEVFFVALWWYYKTILYIPFYFVYIFFVAYVVCHWIRFKANVNGDASTVQVTHFNVENMDRYTK